MRRINWTYVLVAAIVRMFMAGAALVSFSHIIDVAHTLGLGWEAYTVPFIVDGLAVLGMIGRSSKFAESTQKAGLRLTAGAGLISLACNVMAGDNRGQQAYGVLIVAAFVAAEWYAMKLKPAAATRKLDPAVAKARAVKAAATRAANKTAAAAAAPVLEVAPVVEPLPVPEVMPVHPVTPVRRRTGREPLAARLRVLSATA